MEELLLHVDKEVEKVYINLLRKELEHPEKWDIKDNWNDNYMSPKINDNGVYFVTLGANHSPTSGIRVFHNNNKIHEIKFPFWDFKTPKMLSELHKFMPHKKEWVAAQNTTKSLKEFNN
jgi:hypothetical protein